MAKKPKNKRYPVQVRFGEAVYNTLLRLAEEEGLRTSRLLERTIGFYSVIREAQKNGRKILIEDESGNPRQIIFI